MKKEKSSLSAHTNSPISGNCLKMSFYDELTELREPKEAPLYAEISD